VNDPAHFEPGEKQVCICGGSWRRHCKNPDCRWLVCLVCSSVYDVANQRFWGYLKTA
jgi:hypothetical protein